MDVYAVLDTYSHAPPATVFTQDGGSVRPMRTLVTYAAER